MTPRTEAGRALIDHWHTPIWPSQTIEEHVDAIEREAVEAYAARLRDAVGALPRRHIHSAQHPGDCGPEHWGVDRAAVLVLIERAALSDGGAS